MHMFLLREVKEVKLFCFTVNGQEPRFDKATGLLLKVFEHVLGPDIWDNICVIYTRWGDDEEAK